MQETKRVLVVDDCQDAADTLAMLLKLWGHQARCAPDGVRALAIAAEFHPEVILLDIGMPSMDGYELARRLRQQAAGREALLVAVTGYGQEQDVRRSHEAGIDLHLLKPFDPEEVQRLLSSCCPIAS